MISAVVNCRIKRIKESMESDPIDVSIDVSIGCDRGGGSVLPGMSLVGRMGGAVALAVTALSRIRRMVLIQRIGAAIPMAARRGQ